MSALLRNAIRTACCAVLAVSFASAATPANRADCEAAGGTWARFGLRQQELCDLPTPDAGKACRDSSECASACVAPESAPVGGEAQGTCHARSVLLGTCLRQVRDGVVTPAICTD